MKPTLWYVTLLYSILIQQFNLHNSKHTPNQENYFSYHTRTTFLTLWHPSMRYQRLNRRKCCRSSASTGYSISLLGKQIYVINISVSWPPLDLIISPQRSRAGSWGKMLVSDFRFPVRVEHGQLWSLAQSLFKLATITYGYRNITTSDQRYEWRDQWCPSRVAWEKSEKKATPEWSVILFNVKHFRLVYGHLSSEMTHASVTVKCVQASQI